MPAGQAVRAIEVSVGSVTIHLGNGALMVSILGLNWMIRVRNRLGTRHIVGAPYVFMVINSYFSLGRL